MGAFDCDSVFIFWNQDFRFSNIELRGWEICPQSFSWINRTPDITGFPPLLYLKKKWLQTLNPVSIVYFEIYLSVISLHDMIWYDERNLEACMSAVVRFVITRVITDRIWLHQVLLPLQTYKLKVDTDCNTKNRIFAKAYISFFSD